MFYLVRNFFIALFSSGWLILLWIVVECVYAAKNYYLSEEIQSFEEFRDIVVSDHALLGAYINAKYAILWLFLVFLFWSFVFAIKLWPVKKDNESKR